MTSSLAISKQIIGAHIQTLFLTVFSFFCQFLVFINIQIDLIMLKTFDKQLTLTTKKSLPIMFKKFIESARHS